MILVLLVYACLGLLLVYSQFHLLHNTYTSFGGICWHPNGWVVSFNFNVLDQAVKGVGVTFSKEFGK